MVWLNDAFDGKFPLTWSLAIIGALLAGSVAASLLWPAKKIAHAEAHEAEVSLSVEGGSWLV